MAAFPLSPRLLALPLWWLAWARAAWVSRAATVVVLRLDLRHPPPPAWQVRALAGAPEVRALHVEVEGLALGWATLAELRAALGVVREAGKLVVVELEHVGNAEIYLASVADRVWMRPVGEVHAAGLGATLRFAGDALRRVGVRFDMEAAGAYKSFGETFTRAYASPENREAVAALVEDLEAELETAVAGGRGLDRARVRELFHRAPLTADEAVEAGLVDAAGWTDEVRASLEALLGDEAPRLPFAAWWRAVAGRDRLERWIAGAPRVVVLQLQGPVVDGDHPPGGGAIAARPVGEVLARLREDDDVAAVVLDIQSPGGSALASDRIWHAVGRLQARKPVVACFRDVAASGGYYIAAAAAEIVAAPTTLTGSIGVVGGKVVWAEALDRLGVHSERVDGAPHAAMYLPDRPFDPEERRRFRASLERFYRTFVQRVAGGRRQPYDAVERHARGRVWTGRRALEHGLVDHLGGSDLAVERAARLAGVRQPWRVDLRLVAPGSWIARWVRRHVEAAAPGLPLGLDLPAVARLMLGAGPVPLVVWPFEVEVR